MTPVPRSSLPALLLAILTTAAPSARAGDEPQEVVAAIKRSSQEISDRGVIYGKKLVAVIGDPAGDNVDRAKSAYVDVMLSLRRANRRSTELVFPDTIAGRALRDAYQKSLKVQTENCQTLGLEYLDIVTASELTIAERKERLFQVIARQVTIERPLTMALDEAIAAYLRSLSPEKAPAAGKVT